MNEPKVAIYIRLSLADEDTGYRKVESDSVQHQRMLINDWLDRHPQLKDAPREEFVDDGYTGTNTDRPAFQAMMKKLRTGELNVQSRKTSPARCVIIPKWATIWSVSFLSSVSGTSPSTMGMTVTTTRV